MKPQTGLQLLLGTLGIFYIGIALLRWPGVPGGDPGLAAFYLALFTLGVMLLVGARDPLRHGIMVQYLILFGIIVGILGNLGSMIFGGGVNLFQGSLVVLHLLAVVLAIVWYRWASQASGT